MPAISMFYGILIYMYLTSKDYRPPHIHAFYGNLEAVFLISDGSLINGKFPKKGIAMVKEFILKYQKELMDMWDTERYYKLPPLE